MASSSLASGSRSIALPGPLDLIRTLGKLRMKAAGSAQPAELAGRADGAWWSSTTPEGPAAMHMRIAGGRLEGEAWGAGRGWMLDHLGELCGLDDDPALFRPGPGLVHELHRRAPGLRLGRTARVFEVMLPTILGQKVTGKEASRGFRELTRAFGRPAPGPVVARLAPTPDVVADLRYEDLHRFGIERKRAVTLIEVARRAKRLEEIVTMPAETARRRLLAIRGVGPWTVAHVMGVAWGDRDAVPVGDYHVPNTVAWALAGEPRGDDGRMLELLEPYRGHRRRVVVLLKGAGIKAPKYGPKQAIRSFADR